jgi:hypothetical protein
VTSISFIFRCGALSSSQLHPATVRVAILARALDTGRKRVAQRPTLTTRPPQTLWPCDYRVAGAPTAPQQHPPTAQPHTQARAAFPQCCCAATAQHPASPVSPGRRQQLPPVVPERLARHPGTACCCMQLARLPGVRIAASWCRAAARAHTQSLARNPTRGRARSPLPAVLLSKHPKTPTRAARRSSPRPSSTQAGGTLVSHALPAAAPAAARSPA